MKNFHDDLHPEIRDAVRALCAEFPDEYHRRIDEQRAYPEEFVAALTTAGWMAALIPQEYGGSGLGLVEASIIMEEINRSGGTSVPGCAGASSRSSVADIAVTEVAPTISVTVSVRSTHWRR